jgi:hypothetical protein
LHPLRPGTHLPPVQAGPRVDRPEDPRPATCPAARGRDSDHPPDPLALECVARRPGEAHIGGLDALGVRGPGAPARTQSRRPRTPWCRRRCRHAIPARPRRARVCAREGGRDRARFLRAVWTAGPGRLIAPVHRMSATGTTTDPRRTTGHHDRCTAIPSDTTREIGQPDRPDLCASADGRRGPGARAERRLGVHSP